MKAKYKILKWTEEKKEIKSIEEVKGLEVELLALAEETDVKCLPAYAPIKTERLLSHIHSINNSLEPLVDGDKVSYTSLEGTAGISGDLEISDELIVELLTSETIETTGVKIVKIKKPDFLGQSKWLAKYQGRQKDLQPGDSIKVSLCERTSYGHDGEVIHTYYEILEVIEVIKAPIRIQNNLNV